jgi:segregation and condensation protein A
MPELAIKVPDFEGPLDLLIHLIEKDKLDIYDIPIASVTEQYINYLHTLQEFDMEVATGFRGHGQRYAAPDQVPHAAA